MADRLEYKSKWTGEQVDEGIDKALLAISQNDIKQTMGTSPTSVMSQAAVTYAINTIGKTGIEKLNIEPTDNLTVDYSNNIATFNGLKAILKNDEEQTSVPANLKLPLSQGTGIEIKVSDSGNSLDFSSSISLDDYYTKTDLVGRIIPETKYQSEFKESISGKGSRLYLKDVINFANAETYVSAGSIDIYGPNSSIAFSNQDHYSYGYIRLRFDREYTQGYSGVGYYATGTGIQYCFSHITAQLKGDTFIKYLQTDLFNIGKVYLCNLDSTDDAKTYLQGHYYYIGGTTSVRTTTDITPLGLTEEDLSGRIIPKDASRYGQSLFQSNNGYLKMFSASGSNQYMIYGGDDINYYYGGSNLVTINRSGCKFSNYNAAVKVGTDTTGGHLKDTSLQFLSGGSSYGQILANPSKTGLKYIGKGSSDISTTSYEFNDVMTQLSGDAFVSSLTEASALNIGKSYLCIQDSTDEAKTFLKGHVYLVSGESGAYTTMDITALGLTEQDLQGRILPANSTSSFATSCWKINSPQTPKNSQDIAITPRANTSEFQLCTYDTLKAAYGRFGCAWGGGVNSHDGSFTSNIEFKFDETNNTLTYNHTKAGISYDMDNVELKQTYEKKTLNTYVKDEGISPFTYKAEITLDTLISENSIIELINDNAINFATYGFNIGSISGQNLTIYMVGEPMDNITLTFGIRG